MANDNNFKGQSPWGSPPGGGNGSGRGGQRPRALSGGAESLPGGRRSAGGRGMKIAARYERRCLSCSLEFIGKMKEGRAGPPLR